MSVSRVRVMIEWPKCADCHCGIDKHTGPNGVCVKCGCRQFDTGESVAALPKNREINKHLRTSKSICLHPNHVPSPSSTLTQT